MNAVHYVELESKGYTQPFEPQLKALRDIKEVITSEELNEVNDTIFLTHRVFTRVSVRIHVLMQDNRGDVRCIGSQHRPQALQPLETRRRSG